MQTFESGGHPLDVRAPREGASQGRGVSGILLGALLTMLGLVASAVLIQILIDEPVARSTEYAADVDRFSQFENEDRAEFAAAADDQRDAMELLAQSMIDGLPPQGVRERMHALNSKTEEFQRAVERVGFLSDRYAQIFLSSDLPDDIHTIAVQLSLFHGFAQAAVNESVRHQVCLMTVAQRYLGNGASFTSNPTRVVCPSSNLVIYDQADIASRDPEKIGVLKGLDECEAGVETNLDYAAAQLANQVRAVHVADNWTIRLLRKMEGVFRSAPPEILLPKPVIDVRQACGTPKKFPGKNLHRGDGEERALHPRPSSAEGQKPAEVVEGQTPRAPAASTSQPLPALVTP